MKRKKNLKPQYIVIEGDNLVDFISNLIKEIGDKKLSEIDWNKVHIETELDWSGCYYEGDEPGQEITRIYTNIDLNGHKTGDSS